jgi:TfoX/Sxy family transcriptional regulator of competence genes
MDKKSASSWQKAPPDNEIFFEKILKEHPDAEKRRMFGYPCAFIHGNMFFGLFQVSVFLRLSETDRVEIIQRGEATHFEPMPGRPMKEYVALSPIAVSDEEKFKNWFTKSLIYAASLPEKVKKGGEK